MSDARPFDPERIVRVLAEHGVAYVMVGALAARLQGFPRLTADMDITPERSDDNLGRLARALAELDARVFTEGIPEGLAFDCEPRTLANAEIWNLVTDSGRVDLVFRPAGTEGFRDLSSNALSFEVFDVTVAVASLEDILRSKEATGRPQDRQDAAVIREMLARGQGAGSGGGKP